VRKTILVVDDEPDILSSLEAILRQRYAVACAHNGAEALTVIEERHVDLVLLDLMMPVLDGFSFMREVTSRGRDIPIVVISAVGDLLLRARQLGAVECLRKPFDVHRLEQVIARALAEHEASVGDRPLQGGSQHEQDVPSKENEAYTNGPNRSHGAESRMVFSGLQRLGRLVTKVAHHPVAPRGEKAPA
jgi:CheY-like chemotaxis protein